MVKFERNYQRYFISPIGAAFLVLFVSFFMYQFVGGLLTLQFVGLEITKENAGYVRLFTSISQILFMLLLSIFFAKAIYNDFTNTFRIRKFNSTELLISIVGLVVIVFASQIYLYIQTYYIDILKNNYPVVKQITDVLEKLDKLVQKSYKEILVIENVLDYISVVISVALVPAFCEEFLFRGFVQSSFEKRLKIHWAIILTALIFAIFHFNPFAIIPLFVLGAYFSYIVYLTDSIFIAVILHFLNNFFSITIYAIYKTEDVLSAQPKPDVPLITLYFALFFSTLLLVFTLLILKRQISKRKNLEENTNENLPKL
ncbi:MAG: CPBP family intramembrane metalloprotease [Ignavibacteria bacterium]|nr:CPBP family intramembrane metalloprotease [Ignavibacteria bacterium]